MKKLISHSLGVPFMVVTVFLGCQDLDVVNQNQPDEQRALASPGDLESLIKGSFLSWFDAIQSSTPNMSLAMPSDTYTCGWGNFGMGSLSTEPREVLINTSSSGLRGVLNGPWFGLYGAISAATDGIRNIEAGNVSLGDDNERALGFAKLVQGLSHGYIALMFDKGFVLDESVDLASGTLELIPYKDVMDAAIKQLEAAIVIFNANNFTLPADWINGKAYTSAELAQLAHSFIARYMALLPRDKAARAAVNWSSVLTNLDKGLTEDWGVMGDGAGRGSIWYSGTHWYSSQWNVWQRVDYKLIGPSDESTGYSDWLAKAPADRDEFIMESGDKRIWDGTLAANGTQNPGTQMLQIGQTTFIRASYGFSRYGHDRFKAVTTSNNAVPIVLFRMSENDFLRAEALMHTGGSTSTIATLLDKTHVGDGGYPSTASLALGSINDAPNPRNDDGATLWSVLKYEKNMDLLGTWSGLQYWEKRGWGELTTGTLIHFPVPAADLETMGLQLYTFGGVGLPGGAPKRRSEIGEDLSEWNLRY